MGGAARIAAVVLGLLGLLATVGAAAPAPSSATPGAAERPNSDRLLLAVSTVGMRAPLRQTFELNIARGLRFSGFEVSTEPASARRSLATCAGAACFQELGATTPGPTAFVRATVEASAGLESAKRTYAMRVEVITATTGQPKLEKHATCAACAGDMAAHLAYLLATEVGAEVLEQRQRAASPLAPPIAATLPAPPPPVLAPPPSVPAGASLGEIGRRSVVDGGIPEPLARRSLRTKIGVSIVGGLGVASGVTGAVLWLRGRQSTCSGHPVGDCGRTYSDAPTGWWLTGVGAAAIGAAAIWWFWLPARERPDADAMAGVNVAVVPGGLIVAGQL